MAKAKEIKSLFTSIMLDDYNAFFTVARNIIDEEKKKGHFKYARELEDILAKRHDKSTLRDKYINKQMSIIPKDKNGVPIFHLYSPPKPKKLFLSEKNNELISNIYEEYFKREQLNKFGLSNSKVILFHGKPGTGKTLSAHTMAYNLDCDVIYTRFDSLISSYLGETSSNLNKIFDFITKGRYLVIFDEFDTISLSRKERNDSGEIKRVVNSFLQMLDNYKGDSFIICNTNMFEVIDEAIIRRFEKVIEFDYPSDELVKLYVEQKKAFIDPPTDMKKLIEMFIGKSYSEIERILNNALRYSILKYDKPRINIEIVNFVNNI